MKIVLIADTHGKHKDIKVPDGDLIICAGDITMLGKKEEINNFLQWYKELPHKYKVFIPGNHDFGFERHTSWCKENIPENVIYLNDMGTTIEGIKIWGSPITPWFNDWAFNRYRGLNIQQHWRLIPEDTNILITHGPVYGYADELDPNHCHIGEDPHVGCKDLLDYVEKIKPRLFVCGHIHCNGGVIKSNGDTLFVNAASVSEDYYLHADPIVIEWDEIDTMLNDYDIRLQSK